MDLLVACLEEDKNKLMTENGNLCVANQEIISLPMILSSPNIS